MKTKSEAVPAIIHEFWRKNKDDKAAIKLRVTYQRQNRTWILKYPPLTSDPELKPLIGTTILLTVDEFAKTQTPRPRGKFDVLRMIFDQYRKKAKDVIDTIKPFTFESFEVKFFEIAIDNNDLFANLEASVNRLKNEKRISTSRGYNCTLQSLKAFTKKEKLPFEYVSVDFLKRYQQWMTDSGNSKATVGIYLRNVRAIFNEVKPNGVPYPFGRTKNGLYQIPKGSNIKKALTQAQVSTIANYKPVDGSFEHQCRDYWLFSYLCNGINIKDMARLQYANIKGDSISLVRAKTSESTGDATTIEIIITKQIQRILDRWSNKFENSNTFVFPILSAEMSAVEEYRAVQQAVQNINKNMKRICNDLKMEKVTTYTARHSFATVLKRSGASIEFISESLGHKNKATTQNYLAGFEDKERRKWAESLLPDTIEP
jgi:site-specific recombinase XerD